MVTVHEELASSVALSLRRLFVVVRDVVTIVFMVIGSTYLTMDPCAGPISMVLEVLALDMLFQSRSGSSRVISS